MDKICRQYISNVRSLFPIMGKAEKRYIRSLAVDVNDYCSEENIVTIGTLYERYGSPSDIVNTYYSISNTEKLIKQIKTCKWIKRTILLLLLIATTSVTIWCAYTYDTWQSFKREEAVFTETVIE